MKKQDFKVLKTKDLYPFPDNPFHVVEDKTLDGHPAHADFADGGRGENRPHTCGGTVLFEERRAGKSLCHDGERRSNALTLTGTADEKHEPERAA